MPRAKKTPAKTIALKKGVKKTSLRRQRPTADSNLAEIAFRPGIMSDQPSMTTVSNSKVRVVLGIIVLLLVVGVIAYLKRGSFLAARINNSVITRWNLDQRLEAQYGQSVVEQMISEQLIFEEASKKQIKVTPAEIDAKIGEITKQLGGQVNINDLLAQQGMTMTDLRRQVEVQLLVEKLTVGLINVSDQEITDYIDKNRSSMTATDEASLKQEALDALAAQKKSTAVQKWFADLRAKTRIVKYF